MRVVLDTNVLVSAILTPEGSAAQVVQLVLRGDLQLCVDTRILAEYRKVLGRGKFSFSPLLVQEFLEALLMEAQEILPSPLPVRLLDESDRAFLEVAVTGQVEALVTRNVRHLRAAEACGVAVKTPGEFLPGFRS